MIYDRAVSWSAPELLDIINGYSDVVVMLLAGHEHGLYLLQTAIHRDQEYEYRSVSHEINNPLYYKTPGPLHFLVPAIVECVPQEGGGSGKRADGRCGENAAATIQVFSNRLEVRGVGKISRVPHIVLQFNSDEMLRSSESGH